MARFVPDYVVVAALLSVTGALSPAPAAVPTFDSKTPIEFQTGKNCFSTNFKTLTACDLILTQGANTRITADFATAKGLSDDNNGVWELTGKVHIVFDDAVLDADGATVVFSDNRLQKVHVKGAPSRFSHQLKNSAQRNQGRAATIDYDAQTALLRLSGDTWYSDGSKDIETAAYTYNMNDGSFSTNEVVKGTVQPNKHVPPPRTPDRATSQ